MSAPRLTPRYYQKEAHASAILSLEFNTSTLIHLGTGGGKSAIAGSIADDVLRSSPNSRVMFLADQDELCTQPLRSLAGFCGIIPALDKAKSEAPLSARLVVASSQTLSKKKRLERYPEKHFDLVIVDEAHRGTDRDMEIAERLGKKMIGMTATPRIKNVINLGSRYDDVCFRKPMLGLIEEGFAPPCRVIELPIEIDVADVAKKKGELEPEALSTTIKPHLDSIARQLAERGKGRKGIVFLPLIATSKELAASMREAGLKAIHIDGESEERDHLSLLVKNGDVEWICNAGVLGTGVDIPELDAIMVLCVMDSISRYQQYYGRIARVLPGCIDGMDREDQAGERKAAIAASLKPDCVVFDILFQHARLNNAGPACLIAESEQEQDEMSKLIRESKQSEIDLALLKARVQSSIESRLVENLEKAAVKKSVASSLSLEQYAAIIEPEILTYIPTQKWEHEKPSEAQINLIKQYGISTDTIPTRGLASKVISIQSARRHRGEATNKQVRLLANLHHRGLSDIDLATARRMSLEDATKAISSALARKQAEEVSKIGVPA